MSLKVSWAELRFFRLVNRDVVFKERGYLKTSGEVAKDFRDKMEVVEDKMKSEWEKRRRGRKVRRPRKFPKSKPPEN